MIEVREHEQTERPQSGTQRETRRAIRDQAKVVAGEVRQLGHLARTGAEERWEGLKSSGERAYERARSAGGELGDSVTSAVRRRPWTSVGLATGMGVLVGLLIGRDRNAPS
jgi:ElaB/YqjD/DUF883 family membrane-anchored ribosome-binding protein